MLRDFACCPGVVTNVAAFTILAAPSTKTTTTKAASALLSQDNAQSEYQNQKYQPLVFH
jgi:UPF0716 family protein affecting phage T7 exclusion